jgi:hypothetical protein
MAAHGLTTHRAHHATRIAPRPRLRRPVAAAAAGTRTPRLIVTEADVASWHHALRENPRRIAHLARTRAWTEPVIKELQLGLHRGRITIPIRDHDGQLQGVLRYQPHHHGPAPKMIAVPGTRLGMIPHPTAERSPQILLTEGPPDMITARSTGLPAIAVPGDHAWQRAWARDFHGRDITISVHSDPQGRAAGARIAADLQAVARHVEILDLAPERDDGYDLTDWLLGGERQEVA